MNIDALYKAMVRIRVIEEGIASIYHEQEIRCPVHLSTGQEAVAVGVCDHLTQDDWVFSTHRCHAHYLAKGGDLGKMMLELYGKQGGCSNGRGGSMHLNSPENNFYSVPIVASSIPIACGVAKALKGTGKIAVAFFGDAAMESGQLYESLNLAALYKLPVLFVCEDNGLSVSTAKYDRQVSRTYGQIARDCGVSCELAVDGMKVENVWKEAKSAIKHVRELNVPYFIECRGVERYREHCGPEYTTDICDKDRDWDSEWILKGLFRSRLVWEEIAKNEFELTVALAKQAAWPDHNTLMQGVLA